MNTKTSTIKKKPTPFNQYYNIIRELAIADFRLKYHDSALGYVWSMLNPLLMFGVYYYVFTTIFHSTIPSYPIFLLAGIISYAFFQDCTFSGMVALGSKAGIMKKIYFPKTILIFAASTTSILSYVINLFVLFAITFIGRGFTPLVFLTPIPVFCLILFSIGISFIMATMYAYFRDMGQIWNVLVLVIFWLSPVVYNVDNLPQSISKLVYFNPLTRIFVLLRHYLLYNYFDLRFLLMTIIYSVLTYLIGYVIFRKYQDSLAELF
ncbi:MAG: ABC transporter permease [Bacteroidota bacterium]